MPFFSWQENRLQYREQGAGPLLVILPGNTASSACHEGELCHFAASYRAVCLDYLGVGRSDRIAVWPHDWWAQGADQAVALIRHLGEGRAILVGTSGGAVIALLAAIAFPNAVDAVVGDSFVAAWTPEMLRDVVLADRNRKTPDQRAFWEAAHGSDWERVVAADTDLVRRFGDRGGDWFGGRLAQVHCPVLITASKTDHLLPHVSEQVQMIMGQIPDCRTYMSSGGDHPLMWSRPDEFRGIADVFLRAMGSDWARRERTTIIGGDETQ